LFNYLYYHLPIYMKYANYFLLFPNYSFMLYFNARECNNSSFVFCISHPLLLGRNQSSSSAAIPEVLFCNILALDDFYNLSIRVFIVSIQWKLYHILWTHCRSSILSNCVLVIFDYIYKNAKMWDLHNGVCLCFVEVVKLKERKLGTVLYNVSNNISLW
jgi:hypothetical protein